MRALTGLILICVLGLVPGCVTLTGETAGEKLDDATITAEINSIIIEDKELSFFKIDVIVNQGSVVLTGFVPSSDAERRLIKKIEPITGVISVKSHLKVKG